MNKAQRQKVYEKYNGHCAYCGKAIEYKDMQVDHLIPQYQAERGKVYWDEVENEKNYMPACRKCNHYKRANSLNAFRRMIEEIPMKLKRDSYIFNIGLQYGFFSNEPKQVTFYFEEKVLNEIREKLYLYRVGHNRNNPEKIRMGNDVYEIIEYLCSATGALEVDFYNDIRTLYGIPLELVSEEGTFEAL